MSDDSALEYAADAAGSEAADDGAEASAPGPMGSALRSITSSLGFSRATDTGRLKFTVPDSAALIVVFAGLFIFFSIKSPVFATQDNLINVLIAVATIGILACPATMLLIAGQFDLSVGSGVALTSTSFSYLLTHGWSTGTCVLAALAVGALGGLLNGFLVTVIGINALITTLGTLAIYSGFAYLITDGLPIQFDGFGGLALDRPFLNIPWSVYIFFVLVVVSIFLMRMTVYGRSIYAIGANPLAARLAGIRVGRILFITFVASGIAFAIGGLIASSQTGQGSGNAGTGYELSVVTAVVLGGASLAGGRGTIFGSVLGVLIIGIINNGLTLLNVQTFWQDVTRGTLLILAVGFDQIRLRLSQE
ncbi:MAG TPA: ABC transporter permease [Solirubrobacteraceae bacterium]|jgi:ribose transport system permease protein|nr:ABC transporter permease [Solirubrobacteraceae bacterium]